MAEVGKKIMVCLQQPRIKVEWTLEPPMLVFPLCSVFAIRQAMCCHRSACCPLPCASRQQCVTEMRQCTAHWQHHTWYSRLWNEERGKSVATVPPSSLVSPSGKAWIQDFPTHIFCTCSSRIKMFLFMFCFLHNILILNSPECREVPRELSLMSKQG